MNLERMLENGHLKHLTENSLLKSEITYKGRENLYSKGQKKESEIEIVFKMLKLRMSLSLQKIQQLPRMH